MQEVPTMTDVKHELVSIFEQAQRVGGGNFTCGVLDNSYGLPALSIAINNSETQSTQFKPIGLPIGKEQASEIQYCSKAPYGKGEQTIYEGGEIVVQHGNSEVKYDHSQNAWFTPFYFSFYSDCKHCVKPVTSGYRLCLVYNLMYSGVSSTKPTVVDNKDLLNRISETVKLWKGTPSMASTMPLLVYLLSHKYSKAGLRFDCLKGEDTRKIALLKQYISMNHDLELFLGIMKMTECGYGCDGEIEIEETNYRISHAVDLKNNVVNFGRLDLKSSCIVPAHILKELEMDGEEVSFTIIFNIHEKRLKRILAMKDLLLKDGI